MKPHRLFRPLLACLLTAASAGAAEKSLVTPVSAAAAVSAETEIADHPFKIHRTEPVRYPVPLLREGISNGEARLLINIDSTGRLTETMVLAYTHKPFADAALAAVAAWRYEPARYHGENVGTVADITFRFEVDGVLLVERVGAPQHAQTDVFGPAYIYHPHGLRTLDGIPTPVHIAQPIYPQAWLEKGLRGDVVVDFYIDESGAVRMPSVQTADNPLLAAAATAAVREWRFAPPLRKGRPVLAHCQQVFKFAPESAAP